MITPDKDNILSVSQLNQSVASILETHFAWVWVEGELSNLAQPASGHVYFSLKDSRAQIRCAMFRGQNRRLTFQPDNGQLVLVRAKVSLYQPRGDFQLIVDRMEPAGDGALRHQFEQLKQKLAAAGLFSEQAKQALPELPSSIGIITSASGAALHDVLSVIERRFPAIPVKLLPVPVQGKDAAPAICQALAQLADYKQCEVILLVRGGGSLEDLWAFNEESVAHAIFDCPIPIVSGIGHEIDITIADFVADKRAATPTAAAEAVTPDVRTWLQNYDWYQQRLKQLILEKIQHGKEKNNWLRKRLNQQHPASIIDQAKRDCRLMAARLNRAWLFLLTRKKNHFQQKKTQLFTHNPVFICKQKQQYLQLQNQHLLNQMQQILTYKKNCLSKYARTLHAISPLKTLDRGYSITLNADKTAITSSKQVKIGDCIETRLQQGALISRVEKTA